MGCEQMIVELWAITPDAEKLIERAGRVAWDTGDKITDESHTRFIRMLIEKGHESVLEHASATFFIGGVSRAMTHQLVRHRLCAYTQRSQRYVDENLFDFVEPPSFKKNDERHNEYLRHIDALRNWYGEFLKGGVHKEDARYILPNACTTQIVMTANFRQWRHMVKVRTAKDAQWEIREVFKEIAEILAQKAPSCFKDLV